MESVYESEHRRRGNQCSQIGGEEASRDQLSNLMAAEVGVSIDEELITMNKANQAYDASAPSFERLKKCRMGFESCPITEKGEPMRITDPLVNQFVSNRNSAAKRAVCTRRRKRSSQREEFLSVADSLIGAQRIINLENSLSDLDRYQS